MHDIGAIIVSPTRELATQISEVVSMFIKNMPHITHQLFIGGPGRSVQVDMEHFIEEGSHIIVTTPGRLEDILVGKSVKQDQRAKFLTGLKQLEVLILDEADRLLSLGFYNVIGTILNFLPKQRRTGLFSATQTKDVEKLIRAGLRNPVLVSVKGKENEMSNLSTPESLKNFYSICDPSQKFAILVHFLRKQFNDNQMNKVIVFFSTCGCVEYFSLLLKRLLRRETQNIFSIHRQKSKRDKIFNAFRNSKTGILVCTDVMARGVDIPDVSWVVQYDPPSNAEAFVHRCGRTARSGNTGNALLLLLPMEDAYLDFIALNQKVQLQKMDCVEGNEQLIEVLSELRDWQRKDRSIFDKANRAFVSYIQAYTKHECKWVLRLKDLPFGEIATSMGLLKLPKMPELKNAKVTGFINDKPIDFNDIKYKDKQKETSRQKKLIVYRETGNWPGMKPKPMGSKAWSEKLDAKDKRAARKRKKQLKVKAQNDNKSNEDDEDSDDLEDDFKLLKKLKKGKVSQEEFDKRIELGDIGSDSENNEAEDG